MRRTVHALAMLRFDNISSVVVEPRLISYR